MMFREHIVTLSTFYMELCSFMILSMEIVPLHNSKTFKIFSPNLE